MSEWPDPILYDELKRAIKGQYDALVADFVSVAAHSRPRQGGVSGGRDMFCDACGERMPCPTIRNLALEYDAHGRADGRTSELPDTLDSPQWDGA